MYILFFENERCPRKEKPLEILDSSKPFKLWIQDVKFEHISTPYLTVYIWNIIHGIYPFNRSRFPTKSSPSSSHESPPTPARGSQTSRLKLMGSFKFKRRCSSVLHLRICQNLGRKKVTWLFTIYTVFLRFPSVKGFDGLLFNRFPSKQDEISDQFRSE